MPQSGEMVTGMYQNYNNILPSSSFTDGYIHKNIHLNLFFISFLFLNLYYIKANTWYFIMIDNDFVFVIELKSDIF